MNKFCIDCGNELTENAQFCIKCGAAVNGTISNNVTPVVKPKQIGKGTGIASMVLGIIAAFDSFCSLFIFVCLLASGEYFIGIEKLAFGFVFLTIPIILLITGGSLGIASRSKLKNGINLTGLILNLVSLILCIFSIGLLCVM